MKTGQGTFINLYLSDTQVNDLQVLSKAFFPHVYGFLEKTMRKKLYCCVLAFEICELIGTISWHLEYVFDGYKSKILLF